MVMILGRAVLLRRKTRELRKRSAFARLASFVAFLAPICTSVAGDVAKTDRGRYPTIPAEHTHVRALLENAMRFLATDQKMFDPVSGYPFEGWNQDPKKALFLRSFTQLTAVGKAMELLADIVAGNANPPELPPDQALRDLTRLVETLRRDQDDPKLASKGLLVNFLDLSTDKRLAPLASDVEKRKILEAFGPDRGEAIWKALQASGWIIPRNGDREAAIVRGAKFGYESFDGPLKIHGDEATKQKIMEILDQRVVLVVFGDNSNLSASVAKTLGALLRPEIFDRPGIAELRNALEDFLDGQREGYAQLYDPEAGLFYFGWDATKNRHFGWDDAQGNWTTGHMDYFVNEFRGPAIFVASRFGLPSEAIRNLGFKIKPYRFQDNRMVFALAPWEGSAFQAMGLGLTLPELDSPSWRELLGNVVDIEIDYSTRKKLPGFLSESYTGVDTQYTGSVGIPEITVNPRPRITDAASLYTLGVAYSIAPEKVEAFLGANWPIISELFTDHGPWEGYNITKKEAIRFQTTAHNLSLILGLLGTGSDHMKLYAAHRGFIGRLDEYFPRGESVDLLSDATRAFAWSDKGAEITTTREAGEFHVKGDRVKLLGIAFVPERKEGVDLSGGHLVIRYRSTGTLDPVIIALKTSGNDPAAARLIPKEITTQFVGTRGREEEIHIPLPASVGLSRIKEVVLTHERASEATPINLSVTRFELRQTSENPKAQTSAGR